MNWEQKSHYFESESEERDIMTCHTSAQTRERSSYNQTVRTSVPELSSSLSLLPRFPEEGCGFKGHPGMSSKEVKSQCGWTGLEQGSVEAR